MSKAEASNAETCPQCGHQTLSILPGAKRKSCTLCFYMASPEEDDEGAVGNIPFQAHAIDRSAFKRKKSIHLSSLLVPLLLVTGAYGVYQYLNSEPAELEGLRALERSYQKITRMITAEALATPESRAQLRKLIRREKGVVAHMHVSPCLNNPRIYLTNLYGIFEKGMATSIPDFKHSRRVISISSKFVNGTAECKETHAPDQFSTLQLYSDFPEPPSPSP